MLATKFPFQLAADVVSSAYNEMTLTGWESFKEERVGDLTGWLASRHPDRYHGKWNKIIKSIRPLVVQLVNEKYGSSISPECATGVEWDILHEQVELQYIDIMNAPLFYLNCVVPVWELGKLIVGWQGGHPSGEPI